MSVPAVTIYNIDRLMYMQKPSPIRRGFFIQNQIFFGTLRELYRLSQERVLQTLADDKLQQVDNAVAVAPLVVVPAHKLEEVFVQLD